MVIFNAHVMSHKCATGLMLTDKGHANVLSNDATRALVLCVLAKSVVQLKIWQSKTIMKMALFSNIMFS